MPPAPKRRWFRFSLRGLLVIVAMLSTVLAILVYNLDWAKERRAFLARKGVLDWTESYKQGERPSAPGMLWLLGENGVGGLLVTSGEQGITDAKRLFPEADVFQITGDDVVPRYQSRRH